MLQSNIDLRKKIGMMWREDENKRRYKAEILMNLYEGNIAKYVYERVDKEISDEKQRNEIKSRIIEIELTRRIVDKIAKSYNTKPNRVLMNGTPKDKQLFDWYNEIINFDEIGYKTDKNFCNYKESLAKFIFKRDISLPQIKILEPAKYICMSLDNQDHTSVSIVIELYDINEEKEEVLICYSDNEMWIQGLDGDLLVDEMSKIDNFDGVNYYSKLQYSYLNKSNVDIMPYPDDSMIGVSTLVPLLIGDINYAVKYMSYSMMWGRNIKQKLIERGPSSFINLLPNDDNSEITPEIGMIKPEVDIKEVFDGIMMQLALWLNNRGISATAINYDSSSFASGISKMIDEADVTSLVTKNQERYRSHERKLFDFIFKHGHNVWKQINPLMPQMEFSSDCYVDITFSKIEPIKSRTEIISEISEEMKNGLLSKKRAIKRLNPTFSDEEVENLLEEIEEEKSEKANNVMIENENREDDEEE